MSPYIFEKGQQFNLEEIHERAVQIEAESKQPVPEGEKPRVQLTFGQALNIAAEEVGGNVAELTNKVTQYKTNSELTSRIEMYFEAMVTTQGFASTTEVLAKAALGHVPAVDLTQWLSDALDAYKTQNVTSEDLFSWMQARSA